MDIYEYAESINYAADYYEMSTGYIYHIREYGLFGRGMKSSPGIRVSCDGKTIGYVQRG
jgi:hypothetical protein